MADGGVSTTMCPKKHLPVAPACPCLQVQVIKQVAVGSRHVAALVQCTSPDGVCVLACVWGSRCGLFSGASGCSPPSDPVWVPVQDLCREHGFDWGDEEAVDVACGEDFTLILTGEGLPPS